MITNRTKASKTRRFCALAALLGVGLIAGEASATILLCRNNYLDQSDTTAPFSTTLLDLDRAAGAQTSVRFSTSASNQLVRVIFNASAAIGGPATKFLDLGIVIDPAGAAKAFFCPPSDFVGGAFVSGNGTATYEDGVVSAVKQCYARIPTAGTHTIQVQLDPSPDPGAAWIIRDLSLCIDTQ